MGTPDYPKVDVRFLDAAEVQADCRAWAQEIACDYSPDLVVFLAKSGFLFAKPMTEVFSCPMEGLVASRPSNEAKDAFRRSVPWIPRWLLRRALKSRALYRHSDSNIERNIELLPGLRAVNFSEVHRVLVVDDSVDTGWSLVAALDALSSLAPGSEFRTASYCVIAPSEYRIVVNYKRFDNMIVVTATSRYSKEYDNFINEYETWLQAQ